MPFAKMYLVFQFKIVIVQRIVIKLRQAKFLFFPLFLLLKDGTERPKYLHIFIYIFTEIFAQVNSVVLLDKRKVYLFSIFLFSVTIIYSF